MTAPGRRILYCTLGAAPGPVGGAERQAALQARALIARGHDVHMVCPGNRRGRRQGPEDPVIHRLPYVDRRPARTITYLPVLLAWLLLNVRRYDLVHVHLGNLQADVAAMACRIRGVPLYIKLAAGGPRGEIGRLRKIATITRFAGIRRADRVQAISDEINDDLEAIGVSARKIVRIPNGIDTGVFQPASADERTRLRARLGLPTDGVLVLYLGRFATYKGIPDMLTAWREIGGDASGHLVLVGEQAVDAPVGDLPSLPGLIIRPWSNAVVDYLRACDVFVLPSSAEGMSNALLEAMACGLAVVATRVGAAPTMIDDAVSGLLVPLSSPVELGRAIERLMLDPGMRERLGSAAAAAVAGRYAIGPVVDRIEAVYEEILAERAR